MVKVSVVIPTYRSGPGLDRVVDSLDGQSLDQSEFEVLLLDDGSGDGTVDRLQTIAATRPNYHVHELPHSGWPSRPRNVGVRRATGDYVLFMDHDDALYPDALGRAHAFAAEHELDVLNAKEVEPSERTWTWMGYDDDVAVGQPADPNLLMPMMPHKLYRREFLIQHDIRFPEGEWVLWEDRRFNVDALARAHRIGRLSSVAFYQWHLTGRNSSASYTGDPARWDMAGYWEAMTVTHQHFAEVLPPEQLRAMRIVDYNGRVLNWAGPPMLKRGRELTAQVWERMRPFLATHMPAEIDSGLDPLRQARSYLLRHDELDRAWELAEADSAVWASTTPVRMELRPDGRFELRCETSWRVSGRGHLKLRREGEKILRTLSPELTALLPEAVRDVTAAVATTRSTFAVREATALAPFPLPATQTTVELGGTDAETTVTVAASVVLDTGTSLVGKPIGPGTWQVALRCDFVGYFHRKPVRGVPGTIRYALTNGHVDRWRNNRDGELTLTRRKKMPGLLSAVGILAVGPAQLKVSRVGARSNRIRIDLPDLPAYGATTLPCVVLLTGDGGRRFELAGRLRGSDAGAWVSASGRLPAGRYRIAVGYADELLETRLELDVDRWRRARISAA